jgi:amidase
MGLSLTDGDVASFLTLMQSNVEAYNVVERLPDDLPQVRYPRTSGYRPAPEENKHNAWYYKTHIEGASQGKLKGKTVVLKDNVMLAGVPMMNGASTLEGYVPDIDATIVTRILDAAGTIVGKAHCEYFCFSGGSHTSAAGLCTIPTRWATRLAALLPAVRCWLLLAKLTWRLAVIKAARFVCRHHSPGSMG